MRSCYLQPDEVLPIFADVVSAKCGHPVALDGSLRRHIDMVSPSGAWNQSHHSGGDLIQDRLTFQRPRPYRALFHFDVEAFTQPAELKKRAAEFAEKLGPVRNFFVGEVKQDDMGGRISVRIFLYGQR